MSGRLFRFLATTVRALAAFAVIPAVRGQQPLVADLKPVEPQSYRLTGGGGVHTAHGKSRLHGSSVFAQT